MAIDEKKAILRGLSATAQQVREEAAKPESAARVAAARRRDDRRYSAICGPLLLLPVVMAGMALGWQEYRLYQFGLRWGSGMSGQRYVREGIFLIGAGLVMCGAGFGLLWIFKEVCGKKMRIAGLAGNIMAAIVPFVGVFFFSMAYDSGRAEAYALLPYRDLAEAAPALERIRISMGLNPGDEVDDHSLGWGKVPQVVRDVKAARILVLDHGYALELEGSSISGTQEGIVIPEAMSETVAQERGRVYRMDVINGIPPVLRYRDKSVDGGWLNGVLDGSSPPVRPPTP